MKLGSVFALFALLLVVSCRSEKAVLSREITKEEMLRAYRAVECDTNRLELVRKMIREGFPVNHPVDDDRFTFLHYAIIYCDEQLIRCLIYQGASLEIEGIYGTRPVDLVKNGDTNAIWKIIETAAPVIEDTIDGIPKYFLKYLSDLDKTDNWKHLLYINGRPASPAMLKWLASLGSVYDSSDYFESENIFMIKGPPVKDHSIYTSELLFTRVSANKYLIDERLSQSKRIKETGTTYFGTINYTRGEYEKKHGFWFYNQLPPIVATDSGCQAPERDSSVK